MGIISIEKYNNLFWLGRYTERALTTLISFYKYYDEMIDVDKNKYRVLCEKLAIPDIYGSREEFTQKYLFNKNDCNSIYSNLSRAFDNAVVLRDTISSETLAYIQLSLDVLERGKESAAPLLELQEVIDYLFAFWGSADDNVDSEMSRNIMKCGKYVERLDLYIRLSYSEKDIEKEFNKLKNRLNKVKFGYNEEILERLTIVNDEKKWSSKQGEVLKYLEKIFEV